MNRVGDTMSTNAQRKCNTELLLQLDRERRDVD
uniref:Uncharacterized protein n=1 Tax=Arundo donax TaxID=35708 RepID=A0A0A9AWS7_ARUDO